MFEFIVINVFIYVRMNLEKMPKATTKGYHIKITTNKITHKRYEDDDDIIITWQRCHNIDNNKNYVYVNNIYKFIYNISLILQYLTQDGKHGTIQRPVLVQF